MASLRLDDFPTFSYQEDPASLVALQERKNRPVQSCTECRRRKQKCDRAMPCGNCVARGEISKCAEYRKDKDETISDKPLFPSIEDFDVLVKRVRQLEEYIKSNGTLSSGQGMLERSISVDRRSLANNSPNVLPPLRSPLVQFAEPELPARAFQSDPRGLDAEMGPPGLQPPSSFRDHQLEEQLDMARQPTREASPDMTNYNHSLALEDLAFSRTQNLERREHLFRGRSTDTANGNERNGLATNHLSSVSQPLPADGGIDVLEVLMKLHDLMDETTAHAVLQYFCEEIEWLFRCLHIPTFKAQYQDFLTWRHLGRLSIEQASYLALYCTCLCVSLHLMDESHLRALNISLMARDRLAKSYSELTEKLFARVDWAQNHRIETLQAFIIIGEYWHSFNLSERHWALLGTAVKVAQNIGMSRLGPEPGGPLTEAAAKARYGSRWATAADRETGRRVWFSLLELDYTYSPEHNFTYVVQWDRQRSIPPANVDDEELVGFGPVTSHPLSRHTGMTYFINRLSFIYPVRDFVDSVIANDGVRFEFVEETHKSLMACTARLSPFYRVRADPEAFARDHRHTTRLIAERHLINCYGHLRVLRLHRIYLAQSYKSGKFALSRDSVTQSVRFIIEKHLNQGERVNIPLRYWYLNYGLLTATISLFIGICHGMGGTENLMDLELCLEALKSRSGCSGIIASAITLEKLLEEELANKRRQAHAESLEDNRKRKRGLSDGIDERSPQDTNNGRGGPSEPLRNPSFTPHLSNPVSRWDPSASFQLPGIQHQNNAQSSIPVDLHAVGASSHPVAQNTAFVEPNFNTDDASLLEFFRYGLAEWPDSTNIWPPINDFAPGSG
ncbi:hypothetical protein NCC49_005954 [Naganishia albida]|nr:hypothetical protein NCC49_005954 [Naganishia albida]